MRKNFRFLFVLLALVLSFSITGLAQETTGDIEITVKDPNGAVVPNVALTVASSGTGTSATAGFKRTATTDDNGYVRIIKVPPGVYTVTAAAVSGFAERVIPGIQVSLGRVTTVNVDLGVANVNPDTVTVNSSDVAPIDTTDSKIQTNITAETVELLPKGINFTSVLKVSPATRPEPRSGQFQIDGASGSENTFIIDGQEVTNVRTGVLDANSNLPFQLIQEIQVKSSGFEAEYGGATGGVVNVVTKGGGNEFRGEFGATVRLSGLDALANVSALRLNPFTGMPEYYPEYRDNYHEFNPTGNLSGPILKDKVWFFGSYTPQLFWEHRNIAYLNDATRVPTGRVETYRFKEKDEYAFARIDAQPFSRLRLTGSYTYNPIIQTGGIPGWVSALSSPPVLPGSSPPISGAAYINNTGGRQNSQSVTGQGVWTITNNWIISSRVGHYFLNEKLGTYGQGNPDIARRTCSGLSTVPFPAGFGCVAGFNNGIQLVSNTKYDATKRNIFEVDSTFLTSFGGRHEFKGGYQYNGIGNKVDSKTTDQVVLRYGWAIADYSGRSIPSAPNARGAGLLRIFQTAGNVNSKNEGIYFQDKWQPTRRLTFNLGLRTERENVPSFAEGLPGITFDFQDKMAPRLGVAYDLTGDGKTKVSGFYGWFYDRFKYELPRGSFGGDLFHDFFFEIFDGDTFASFTRESILGGATPVPGGRCPSTTSPIFGKVRCDIDNRIPSNAGLPLTEAGGIDPDIKAFRQSEFTLTFERDLGHNMVFSGRFTHKQVDHIIEDAGFPNAEASEFYIIGNPGEGLYAQTAAGFNLQALKPKRNYNALEFRLDRRFADDYYFNLNYTYSRLTGNYSGLASSDEEGRLSPNVNRYFDQPQAGWTVQGGPDTGKLATDRPHVMKFYGAYRLDWGKRFGFGSNMSTDFQLFTTAASGTLLTSIVSIEGVSPVVLTKRGDLGRTPTFFQTDVALRHRFRFGPDNRYTLVAETDILNVFNTHIVTNKIQDITLNDYAVNDPTWGLITPAQSAACDAADNQQPCLIAAYRNFQAHGAPLILADAQSAANRYELYKLASSFQGPRIVRFGLRFLF